MARFPETSKEARNRRAAWAAAAVAALIAVAAFQIGRTTLPPASGPGSKWPLAVAEAAAARGLAVVAVVRHAEKASGDDPSLSAAGRTRARALAELFDGVPVHRLIASDLRRTQETIAPLARKKDLRIERTPSQPEAKAASEVAQKLKELRVGEFAVVAHHSFTIAAILAEFDWKVPDPRDHDDVWLLFLDGGEAVGHLALRVPAPEPAPR